MAIKSFVGQLGRSSCSRRPRTMKQCLRSARAVKPNRLHTDEEGIPSCDWEERGRRIAHPSIKLFWLMTLSWSLVACAGPEPIVAAECEVPAAGAGGGEA